MYEGVLLVDKPVNWTSFDVVGYLRGLIAKSLNVKSRFIKVGHAGTLDPFATGLLIILVGKSYTKKSSDLLKYDKTYQVVMRLGQKSSTGDTEGIIKNISSNRPTEDKIIQTFSLFEGKIKQLPPIYSAIKINGQRAYKIARAGAIPDMPVKNIQIYNLDLQEYNYPYVNFITNVSSGTYIRSLVSDIGDRLKTGAYTKELRRTKIGDYDIKDAIKLEDLNILNIQSNLMLI